MTPYQLRLYVDDYNERIKAESEEKLTLAYLTAYWQRVKKMPSLDKVLNREKTMTKQKMSNDEMLEQIKNLNAAFGGNVI